MNPRNDAAALERPTTGLRIALERGTPVDTAVEPPAGAAGAALQYVGSVLSPTETLAITALVAGDGSVTVTVDRSEPDDLAPARRAALVEKVRLLVRTLVRQARSDELPPPRRINRWRES